MASPPPAKPYEVARAKLVRVFGDDRGQALLDKAVTQAGLKTISTPDELLAVARALESYGGIEGAVGAMLSVSALMMGAKT